MAMERVALYVRVSTEEQAINGDSVEAQKEDLTEYAKKQCYDVIGYYIDDGYSATTLKRPNLQRLLADIEAGKVDLVLFTKIDRWSRGVRNYYKLQDILEKHNVTWNAIFERYNTTTAEGQLHINIMLSVAENEAAVTSERIRTVFRSKLEIPNNFKEIYDSLTQLEKRRFWCEVIKGVEIGRFKEPFKIIL